ncbi:MAG: cobalamin biosynthesis protein CobD, partial [Synergistaceae bacterium]|nr:cobalamin biosynthesis protein CobD [Synergistaceae bacterium]
MKFALILCLAVIADEILGDPRNFPHPVRLIGNAINFWQSIFFRHDSFFNGLAVVIMTLITAGLSVYVILYVTGGSVILQVYLLYSALAWRDLKDETLPVLFALMNHDIEGARKSLSFVVGRDTDNLDEAGITRAVIETVAENSVDGVMSVIFFAVIGHIVNHSWGMCVSVWLFKSASTLDSMLGYESLGKFGTPSARLDDILNFIPARLGGIIIILAGIIEGCNVREALRAFISGRLKHK